ncbi:MAG: FliM/FliN family flagellar motor switch protein [Planctomycetes bacterium]|nr:FliM/FliN family flagellar motor switch protein [Planctomycetota bacterium]
MSTIIDQSEIDALLEAAKKDTALETPAPAVSSAAVSPAPTSLTSRQAPSPLNETVPPAVKRLLRLRVPLIVELGRRAITMAEARTLSLGMILEFERQMDLPCELLVNNRPIGNGEVVRIGDNFGLRIQEINDAATRIRSLGK